MVKANNALSASQWARGSHVCTKLKYPFRSDLMASILVLVKTFLPVESLEPRRMALAISTVAAAAVAAAAAAASSWRWRRRTTPLLTITYHDTSGAV